MLFREQIENRTVEVIHSSEEIGPLRRPPGGAEPVPPAERQYERRRRFRPEFAVTSDLTVPGPRPEVRIGYERASRAARRRRDGVLDRDAGAAAEGVGVREKSRKLRTVFRCSLRLNELPLFLDHAPRSQVRHFIKEYLISCLHIVTGHGLKALEARNALNFDHVVQQQPSGITIRCGGPIALSQAHYDPVQFGVIEAKPLHIRSNVPLTLRRSVASSALC